VSQKNIISVVLQEVCEGIRTLSGGEKQLKIPKISNNEGIRYKLPNIRPERGVRRDGVTGTWLSVVDHSPPAKRSAERGRGEGGEWVDA